MKNKNIWLFLVSVVLCIIYMVIPEYEVITEVKEEKQLSIKVLNEDNIIKEIELEEYLIGVVAAEMPASFNLEALKAQAIASRTYAMYKINNNDKEYDVTTDVTTQSYITLEQMKEKWTTDFEYYFNIIKNAVDSTANLVMKSNDEIICSYYFAISNGQTVDSVSVFNQDLSYISSVDSTWDLNVNNYEMTVSYEKNIFCEMLNLNCDSIDISNINRSNTNHVDNLLVNNILFTGIDFRFSLGLRSTDFYIDITDKVYITTKGYGHGVGMSQYGANEMVKTGSTYNEILNYYYQNIKITNI